MKKISTDLFVLKYADKKCTLKNLQLVAPFDMKYENFNEKDSIIKSSSLSISQVIRFFLL